MVKQIFVFFIILFSFNAFAQEIVTLSGFVSDGETGEALIGTNIYVPDKQQIFRAMPLAILVPLPYVLILCG